MLDVHRAIGGERVAAVHEGVNEDALDAVLLGHAQDGVQMGLLRVDSAVREQAEKMQAPIAGARFGHGFEKRRVLLELAGLDHHVDLADVHVHNAAGADVEVADFAVAHLPRRKADKTSAGVDERVGKFSQQLVVVGLVGERDGVGVGRRGIAPTVQNDENQRLRTH